MAISQQLRRCSTGASLDGSPLRLNDDAHARSLYRWLLHCPNRQLCNRIMRKRILDEAAGYEAVVRNVDVVLAPFAHHIRHLNLACNPVEPTWLQFDEVVHVAFCWGRR